MQFYHTLYDYTKQLTFHDLIDVINKYESNTTTSTFKTLLQSYLMQYVIDIDDNAVNRNWNQRQNEYIHNEDIQDSFELTKLILERWTL